MLIRAALPHDLAVITAIYDHAVRHGTASFELQPPDQEEMTRRYEALLAGGYPYLVAEIEGEIAGYAYAGPYRAAPGLSLERRGFDLCRAAVAPQGRGPRADRTPDRGRGGGRLPADDRGDRRFRAMPARSSFTARAGFRMVGTFDNVGFKFGRWLDSVLMQRPLGAGATTAP